MKRPRQVMVAVPDGDGMKIVPLSEALSGRKDIDLTLRNLRLPKGGRIQQAGTDWLIQKYKEDGRVEDRAVQAVWAGLKLFYEGERDASGRQIDGTIPFDLFDIIGSKLAGKRGWRKDLARARAADAEQTYRQWQAMAAEIWRRHPSWSKRCVAELIAEKTGENANTIRRKISQPKNSWHPK
jgi:hypothetical protein